MRIRRSAALTIVVLAAAAAPAAQASNRPDPALGNGLGRLLDNNSFSTFAAGPRINQERLTIRDAEGRVLVDVSADAGTSLATLRERSRDAGLKVTATDAAGKTLEGFVALDHVRALAAVDGLGTIAQALRPYTHVGAATSQGVALERVDQLPAGLDGTGLTIGALSDSYDAATDDLDGNPLTIHAADDVASGDLPGPGNPNNTKPVRVLEDLLPGEGGSDEGRAMLQIAHDIAPKAKLCFATAFTGLIGFAQNVRALADDAGPCRADVVVDDVVYFDEPMFSDSVLSDAINFVSHHDQSHYFSSAGNEGDQQAWASPVRLVGPSAASGLHLSDVDPALYDGGFQDMDPGPGTDVAQTVHLGDGDGIFDVQWDDPVDLDGTKLGDLLLDTTGNITDGDQVDEIPFSAAAVGDTVQFKVDGIPSGSTDLILGLIDPDGQTIAEVDTGSSPEVLAAKITKPGVYTITVSTFAGDTGDYTLTARKVLAPSAVSTDFNLLFFDMDGNFLGASADINPLSGRPSELVALGGPGDVQLAISRAGTGPVRAKRLRDVLVDAANFMEYADPLAPAVFGHATARDAISVAAYDPFRPFLPEWFTSPGGDLPIVFNSNGKRYSPPQIRRTPSVAAADGGNNTFFSGDTMQDPDTQPNFFGTSASAPHAAAIAALVLEANGGGTSLTPTQLRNRLQGAAFRHDLNPDTASGSAGGLTISAASAQGAERDLPGAMNDPQYFTLRYTGSVPLSSVELIARTANPTGRGAGFDDPSLGMVFDPRPFDGQPPFTRDGFPFVVGSTSGGLKPTDVTAAFSGHTQTTPGGTYPELTLSFRRGTMASGRALRFGVDRDEAVSGFALGRGIKGASEGNGADSLGGAVVLPSGTRIPEGLLFVGHRQDGSTFSGYIVNQLGTGWTPLDGYGVINAQAAVAP